MWIKTEDLTGKGCKEQEEGRDSCVDPQGWVLAWGRGSERLEPHWTDDELGFLVREGSRDPQWSDLQSEDPDWRLHLLPPWALVFLP